MTRWLSHPAPRGRALAVAAAVVIVAAVGGPAHGAAAADDRPADPGVRCGAKIGPGEYEFYLPGAKVTDVNGNKWVCGADGQWFRDYSALQLATRRGLTAATTATLQR
jgi:hypothetical protein